MVPMDASPMPVSSGPKESRSGQVVAICLAMLSFSIITVTARILIRVRMVQGKLGADDWAILVSLVFSIAFIIDVVTRMCPFLLALSYDQKREAPWRSRVSLEHSYRRLRLRLTEMHRDKVRPGKTYL